MSPKSLVLIRPVYVDGNGDEISSGVATEVTLAELKALLDSLEPEEPEEP